MFHADGEILAARAAAACGIPYCMSTMSICSIEDVRAATGQPFWFQQYLMKDRGFNQELIDRAAAAQCSALMLTLDLQVMGERRRDPRNGLTIPPRLTLRNALDVAMKPAWALKVLFGKRRTFGNLVGRIGGSSGIRTLSEWTATQFDASANWRDVEWVRSRWPGKLILKGVLDAEDARFGLAAGADAIVVSNHGGRQLDGAPSSISVLPEIVDGDRRALRSAVRRRHPLRPGHRQGPGARRPRDIDRQVVSLCAGGGRRGGRDQGRRDHAQ